MNGKHKDYRADPACYPTCYFGGMCLVCLEANSLVLSRIEGDQVHVSHR